MRAPHALLLALALGGLLVCPAAAPADTVFYNNDFPLAPPLTTMASASTPAGNGFIEHESADDFILTGGARLTGATFTGLVPAGATIQQVVLEIYRVFPFDSDSGRTSGPPTFSTPKVPTRVNSPSDVAFATRDSMAGELSFTTSILASSFAVSNSVVNGINPKPNQTTGGDKGQTGQEVQFTVTLNSPIVLPPDHYFFVPQVLLGSSGNTPFLWLAGTRPPAVTPFAPDLQSWIRDANLEPDWLRIGTDIVGAGTFNAAFSVSGVAIPEPSSVVLFGIGCVGLIAHARGRRRQRAQVS
jgi:hypothetical protein